MTWLSSLWAAIFLATGGLSLLPQDLRPREPIQPRIIHSHPFAPPMVQIGSEYEPTVVPSDSAWVAKPDTAWTDAGNAWHREEMTADSLREGEAFADSVAYIPRADSLSQGLIDPRTFTWSEFQYQKARAQYFYRSHNRKFRKKLHIKQLNGHTDEHWDWT